jgi:hypothetical protein
VSEGDRKLTRTGMLFGTPEYMSPEQARGDQVDHRVDIYAMGCILYQLIVGRVPFEAENFMGILSQHLTENPPPIEQFTLDRVGAPPEVANIVMRALAKHRDERWPTIDDLANAIRALHGEAEQPINPVTVPRAQSAVVGAPQPPQGARVRTQWTGNLQIPTEEVPPARTHRSKAPWIAAGAILVAGGAIAGYVLTRPAKTTQAPPGPVVTTPPTGSGTPDLPTVGSGATPTTPTTPPETPVPRTIELSIRTKPAKAAVIDLDNNEQKIGETPFDYTLPGGRTSRRFALRLKGYQDKVLELVPDYTPIEWSTELVKGKTGSGKQLVVEKVEKGGTGSTGTTTGKTPGTGKHGGDPPVVKPAGDPDPVTKPAGDPDPVTKPGVDPDPVVKPPPGPGDPDLIELKPPEEKKKDEKKDEAAAPAP